MLPILARLGPVTVYSFGFFLALAFVLATFVTWRQARKLGVNEEKILDTYFMAIFLALIVGRLVYVWANWGLFLTDYSRIILFFKYPGISFPWTVVTMFVVSWGAARSLALDVLGVWDNFSFAAVFAAFFVIMGMVFDGSLAHNLAIALVVWSTLWLALFVVIDRQFGRTVVLADLAKKKGLFFLCYLIFQLVSLLMTQWVIKDWGKVGIYGLGVLGTVGILSVRYLNLLQHVYHTISQRRSHPN